jgi:mannosyltransferase
LQGRAGFCDNPRVSRPELIITNFNQRFTGVSSTAAAVTRAQIGTFDLRLVGQELPGLPAPIPLVEALRLSRRPKEGRPFTIWHVRRNTEMQAALFARDVLRLPIRIVFTSAAQRVHSRWPRFLISRMDRVIATTDEAASFLHRVAAVVPHGVDTDAFRPAEDRRAAWAATGYLGTSGIATIGRIRPEKGTDRFVETAIRVLPALPDLTALVIGRARDGDTEFLDGLRRRVAEAGLGDRIIFTGELPPDELRRIVPALSLLVALPRYEGYGMTPLEAMASGVPVVATDTGHFRAFVGQNEAGRIVEPDEAAAAILSLLSRPADLENLGRSARHRAESGFAIEGEARAVARVYDSLWNAQGA